jgi:peptidyl-prolyl cis-trans isomerase A (cyclophilin A)
MANPTFPPINVPGEGDLYARLHTSMGNVVVRLEETRTPQTVANFVGLATGTIPWRDPATGKQMTNEPLYNGVRFHRVIPDFMAQCGDPLTRSPEHANRWGTGGPGYQFADEFHPELRHAGPGVLSMANAGAGTNGSQWFITHRATPHLNNKHSVFGNVVAGMDVINKMGTVKRNRSDRPDEDILLERVEIFRSVAPPTALAAFAAFAALAAFPSLAGVSRRLRSLADRPLLISSVAQRSVTGACRTRVMVSFDRQ